MRALVAFVLLACAPSRPGRPCPSPPPPSADEFSACGGMVYHTPSGDGVRYAIKFANTLPAEYELADLCILVDGAPLFTAKDIETSPKSVRWDGRLSYAHHRVAVQARVRVKANTDVMISVRAAREIAAIDGGALDVVAFAQATAAIEKRPGLKLTHPKDTPEPKCEL